MDAGKADRRRLLGSKENSFVYKRVKQLMRDGLRTTAGVQESYGLLEGYKGVKQLLDYYKRNTMRL